MTEENKPSNSATGCNGLPNELHSKTVAHAVDERDAWKAEKTFVKITRLNSHFRNLASVQAMRTYKDNLEGARDVSNAIIKAVRPDGRFPKNATGRTLEEYASAVASSLQSESPPTVV